MEGADEYYDLFNGKSQQIGRLFFQLSTHARGKCFEIYVLPEGVEVTGDRIGWCESVEVYGMINGKRGWSEKYGWIHDGKWRQGFLDIIKAKEKEIEIKIKRVHKKLKNRQDEEIDRRDKILSAYS